MRKLEPVEIHNAQIGYKNFSGAEGTFNRLGDRNFVIFLEHDVAVALEKDGWNVRWPKPREDIAPEDDKRSPLLDVVVSYKRIPPKIVLVADDKITPLDEDQIGTLDYAEIEFCDIIISPFHWSNNGREGVKAYLRSLYVNLKLDSFVSKYGV